MIETSALIQWKTSFERSLKVDRWEIPVGDTPADSATFSNTAPHLSVPMTQLWPGHCKRKKVERRGRVGLQKHQSLRLHHEGIHDPLCRNGVLRQDEDPQSCAGGGEERSIEQLGPSSVSCHLRTLFEFCLVSFIGAAKAEVWNWSLSIISKIQIWI